MALSGNQRPDHSTIAAFVSSMKDENLPLFRAVLLVCEQEKLLGGTFFALDGVKLPGNASKRWSGTLNLCCTYFIGAVKKTNITAEYAEIVELYPLLRDTKIYVLF
jgi:hypothetical protein